MNFMAKLKREDSVYLVSFPVFPNVNTFGETREEALENASEALNGALLVDFERGYRLPDPVPVRGKNSFAICVLPNIAIAYQLRRLRRNQSQADVARRIGISYQAYQKLENPRKCNPTVKTLEKIGAALGKTLDVVFH